MRDPLLFPRYLVASTDQYGYKTEEERVAAWNKVKNASLTNRDVLQIAYSVIYSHVYADNRIQFDWSFLICLIASGHNQTMQFRSVPQKKLLYDYFIPNIRAVGWANLNRINDFMVLCTRYRFELNSSLARLFMEFAHRTEMPKNKNPPISIIFTSYQHPMRQNSQLSISMGDIYKELHLGFPVDFIVRELKHLTAFYRHQSQEQKNFYDVSMPLQLLRDNAPDMIFPDRFSEVELAYTKRAFRNLEEQKIVPTRSLDIKTQEWLLQRGSNVHSSKRTLEIQNLPDRFPGSLWYPYPHKRRTEYSAGSPGAGDSEDSDGQGAGGSAGAGARQISAFLDLSLIHI